MMMKPTHDSLILVTGAAGAVGSIGRNLTEMLLAKGHKVRALVRREDERAEALRQLGAEVMQGDLTDLIGMSVPELTQNTAIQLNRQVSLRPLSFADYLSERVERR